MGLAAAGYRFGEPDLPAKAISPSLKPQVSVRREALHIRASLYGAIRDRLWPMRCQKEFQMRLKTMAKLFVASIVILTGSPALATQIARHDAHCRSCEQKADSCRAPATCVTRASDALRWNGVHATHDRPAGMILN